MRSTCFIAARCCEKTTAFFGTPNASQPRAATSASNCLMREERLIPPALPHASAAASSAEGPLASSE
eukprot:scaffold48063_cov28-Tisochrysis_lutea.AAC.8